MSSEKRPGRPPKAGKKKASTGAWLSGASRAITVPSLSELQEDDLRRVVVTALLACTKEGLSLEDAKKKVVSACKVIPGDIWGQSCAIARNELGELLD